jgi:hypothetical protein
MANPTVPILAQISMPLLRSSAGKTLLTIDREAAKNTEAPYPWLTRAATSHQSDCANP